MEVWRERSVQDLSGVNLLFSLKTFLAIGFSSTYFDDISKSTSIHICVLEVNHAHAFI